MATQFKMWQENQGCLNGWTTSSFSFRRRQAKYTRARKTRRTRDTREAPHSWHFCQVEWPASVVRVCIFPTFLPLSEIRNFSQIYSVVRALAQFLFCFESLFPCVLRFPQHPPPLTNLLPVQDVHMTSWLPSWCFKEQYHLSGTQVG